MHGTSAGTRGQVLNNKVESAAPNHQGDNHSPEPRRFTNSEIACAAAKAKGTVNLELQIKGEVSEFTPGFPSFSSILQVPVLCLPAPTFLVHYLNSHQNHN